MITVPFFTNATEYSTPSRIPKRIYQTWKTREVNDQVAEHIEKIKRANPTYDYYLFGDKECREYLIQNYPPAYINAFDDLIPGAFKADFWRYAILAKDGGVYIDLDMNPLKPMDYILGDSDFVSIKDRVKHTDRYALFQSFIGSVPNHPFVVETLMSVLKNIQNHYHGRSPLRVTGPLAMGGAIKRLLNGGELKVGNTKSKRFGKYTILLWADIGDELFPINVGIVTATIECIVDVNDVRVFDVGKISGYRAHQSYSTLFHHREIYRGYKRDFVDNSIIAYKNFFVDIRREKVRVYNIFFFVILSIILINVYRNYKLK
jgi:mannosyltransferase OCH1-like enzyme